MRYKLTPAQRRELEAFLAHPAMSSVCTYKPHLRLCELGLLKKRRDLPFERVQYEITEAGTAEARRLLKE